MPSQLPGCTYKLVSDPGLLERFTHDTHGQIAPRAQLHGTDPYLAGWRSGEPVTTTSVEAQPLVVI
jgi:hypothetical protein